MIFVLLFSILIQLLINKGNVLLFQLFSISFPFSNDIFILFGNLSQYFIISSLKYNPLNLLSTSFNNSSSLSFNAFLNLVNIFWIYDFSSSLVLLAFSHLGFNSFIFCSIFIDISSKLFILSFNLFLFSFSISSMKHTSQSECCPFSFPFNFAIHSAQHNSLCFLQKKFNLALWHFSLQNPVNISLMSFPFSNLIWLWFWNYSEWCFSHLLHIYNLHSPQKDKASISLWFKDEHFSIYSIY